MLCLLCTWGEVMLEPIPLGIARTQKLLVWGKRWTGI